jgi:homoserine O-acetyltransferase
MRLRPLLAALLFTASIAQAQAQTQTQTQAPATEIVEKRVFEAATHQTRNGGTIANLRVGYQTAGTLNAAGDNAVLVAHFFSGNSHAFGRYAADQPAGYWDAIIGPGRAIDTDRFFVVSSDTLVNFNLRDGRTVTTGPPAWNPPPGGPGAWSSPSSRSATSSRCRSGCWTASACGACPGRGRVEGALQAIEWARPIRRWWTA